MKLDYHNYGCTIAFDGEIETVLCDSTGRGWLGIGFTDVVLGDQGRVSMVQQGVHFGLSLRPRDQVFVCTGQTYRFSEDNVAVLQPGAAVHGSWSGRFRNLTLKLAPETVERISDVPLARIGIRTKFLSTGSQNAVEYLLRAISVDVQGGCPYGPILVESVAATLLRLFSTAETGVAKPAPRLNSSEAAILRDLITTHLAESLSLTQLADATGASIGHLVRAFKTSFGMTPYQYILRARVLRAQELIKTGTSLKDAATQVGFSDASQMSKTFRRVLGRTPSAVAREEGRADGTEPEV